MVLTINSSTYNTDDILYINTIYKLMGLYVIEIKLKSQKDPLVLQYTEKSAYDDVVEYIKRNISIV